MKICFLIRSLDYGGAERQLVLLAKGLQERGHTVTVITFYPGEGFELILKAANVKVYSLDKKGRWDLAPFFKRLIKLIRTETPDILHGYLSDANLLASIVKCFIRNLKVVWGIRASNMDLSKYDWLARFSFKLNCLMSRTPDLIIVNSEAGKDYHVSCGFPIKKMMVIPNGIDIAKFQKVPLLCDGIKVKLKIEEDVFLVGIVARLDPMKDYETFIKAANLIIKVNENVRFVCVGSGSISYSDYLRNFCQKYHLGDYVVWAGAMENMAEVYSELDLLVSCSVTEGFSNVIAEAMACELPCVVTDVGDSAAIVGNNEFIVPSRDEKKLADAVIRFLALSEEQRVMIGKKVRANIVERYSLNRLIDTTENNLVKLIN
jgi:glycosyltransferase involved in cell wall biosynthesis